MTCQVVDSVDENIAGIAGTECLLLCLISSDIILPTGLTFAKLDIDSFLAARQ